MTTDLTLRTYKTRDWDLATIQINVQLFIFMFTFLGNSLVLFLVINLSRKRRREQLGRMYTMIGHLSLADLLVATLNQLPQLAWDMTFRFKGGPVLCKAVKFGQVLTMYASSYVLVSTAIDRYMAICHPMKTHAWTTNHAHKLVGVAWLIGALFSTPQLFLFSWKEVIQQSGEYDCLARFQQNWTVQLYTFWFTIAVYLTPFVLLSYIYTKICYVVWRSVSASTTTSSTSTTTTTKATMSQKPPFQTTAIHHHQQQKQQQNKKPPLQSNLPYHLLPLPYILSPANQNLGQTLTKAKTRTVKLTLAVVVGYLLCWAPFFVAQFWWALDPNAPVEEDFMVIPLLLGSLNSCINPWIYMAFSDQLRLQASNIFCKYCRCNRRYNHRNVQPQPQQQYSQQPKLPVFKSSFGSCNSSSGGKVLDVNRVSKWLNRSLTSSLSSGGRSCGKQRATVNFSPKLDK
ncbi:hypothetical protein HELRODRAFT_116255 [Helobdella robusta]|uniref:G-protein coupled receptors family 1 profile domain-containing protein n=1 Tax=Helobdella robusta TaxID=6412 RepID=T1EGD8_HELRO|nr:hypothetical protein HELRODRAFT_116255 [Helobdella robusta]ESN91970.1 hypothetical protein HELRODRAFT_116255 [Helobdella robusta]